MSQRNIRAAVWILGVIFITPALFMSQVFGGPHVTFAVFHSLSGVVTIGLTSLMGALIAAAPFGVLFGLLTPDPVIRNATLFALPPVLLIFAFGVWVAPPPEQLWWSRIVDAVWFLLLFPSFAAVGARLCSSSLVPWRPIWTAMAFAALGVLYYFGPYFYLRYVYAGAA